ncbi:hypothetical protein V6N12_069962 [Hibiscus sabdariffa]|uniref:Uncharacterized protein n=1 Tax=Hibiscus sabdariffa TaxID=183260 RepID=A0ABR2FFE4_9ROSI
MISDSSPELAGTRVNACEDSGNTIDVSASSIVSSSPVISSPFVASLPADFVSNNNVNTNNVSESTLIPTTVGIVQHDDDGMVSHDTELPSDACNESHNTIDTTKLVNIPSEIVIADLGAPSSSTMVLPTGVGRSGVENE